MMTKWNRTTKAAFASGLLIIILSGCGGSGGGGDSTPPTAPTGLYGTREYVDAVDTVTLWWAGSSSTAKYKVYRSLGESWNPVLVGETTNPRYTDTTIPQNPEYRALDASYRVTAVSSGGTESASSNICTLPLPLPPMPK